MTLLVSIVLIFLAVIVGVIASKRGRSGVGWALLAIVISPVFAGLLVLVLPNKRPKVTPVFE